VSTSSYSVSPLLAHSLDTAATMHITYFTLPCSASLRHFVYGIINNSSSVRA